MADVRVEPMVVAPSRFAICMQPRAALLLAAAIVAAAVAMVARRRLQERVRRLSEEMVEVSADASVGHRLSISENRDIADLAVTINRPFINGGYFDIVRGKDLPGWAADFDCESWAQFSLKFILSHPAVNCVLTETANPKHAKDNLGAGFGRLPDEKERHPASTVQRINNGRAQFEIVFLFIIFFSAKIHYCT